MKHGCWSVASVGLLLSACAGYGPGSPAGAQSTVYPPAVYAHRVSTNDLGVYWNCTRPELAIVQFEGVVRHVKGGRVKFMELELSGADRQGRHVSGGKTALKDIVLSTDQISPSALQIRPTGSE